MTYNHCCLLYFHLVAIADRFITTVDMMFRKGKNINPFPSFSNLSHGSPFDTRIGEHYRVRPAGLKHRSQVRSGHRSGHRSGKVTGQVTGKVRSGQISPIVRTFFCQRNWLYFWGIQKLGFINGVDNANWPRYRDFRERTSYLLLGLYHASVRLPLFWHISSQGNNSNCLKTFRWQHSSVNKMQIILEAAAYEKKVSCLWKSSLTPMPFLVVHP